MSRTLPSGGSLQNTNFSQSGKTVDKPNSNSKFSRRGPSRTGESSVFNDAIPAPTPRAMRRSVTPVNDCDRTYRKEGVRISGFEKLQQERERFQQDHPRAIRKSVERAPSPVPEKDPVITANGLLFSSNLRSTSRGNRKNVSSIGSLESTAPAEPPKPFYAMERFRNSPRLNSETATNGNVLIPETMLKSNDGFSAKVQRFAYTPRSPSPTLCGVFSADPFRKVPPPYTPRAPFHTD